jgi:hypothetical protein
MQPHTLIVHSHVVYVLNYAASGAMRTTRCRAAHFSRRPDGVPTQKHRHMALNNMAHNHNHREHHTSRPLSLRPALHTKKKTGRQSDQKAKEHAGCSRDPSPALQQHLVLVRSIRCIPLRVHHLRCSLARLRGRGIRRRRSGIRRTRRRR